MAHASGHLSMTMSDDDVVTSRAAMATSEKSKGDDDDYLSGKSFERGLVRVGQPQEGFPEHKGCCASYATYGLDYACDPGVPWM